MECDLSNPNVFGTHQSSSELGIDKKFEDSEDEQGQIYFQIPEIIESLFQFLGCENLKICRLVSKKWNFEACRYIRKRTIIHISEYEKSKISEFEQLLSSNMENGFPLPFHFYSLDVDSFSDESLSNVIRDERLIFRRPPSFDDDSTFQTNLQELLTNRSSHLQSIHFTLKDGVNLGLSLSAPFFVPNLLEMRISGSWESDEGSNLFDSVSADFLVTLINAAPKLEKIISSFSDEKALLQIMSQANLSNINYFSASSLTPHLFWKLRNLSLPKLKTLHALIDPDLVEDEFVSSEATHSVVTHFSPTLEDLFISWNFNSINDSFPFCPKLKNLAIKYWSGSLGAFNIQKLPSLKRLHVFDCVNELSEGHLNPHRGVEAFTFECMKGTGVRFGLYTSEEFNTVLENVKLQFPSLNCLDLDIALTTKSIRSIIQKFPNLESLILDADNEYEESIFTGLTRKHMEEYLKLKNLVLSRAYEYRFPNDISVTNNAIKYGLSKIPNLSILQMDWEVGLSAHIICDHLSHLTKLIVNYSDDLDNLEPLDILKKYMSHVVLKLAKSNYTECLLTRSRRTSTRRPANRRRRQ